MPEDIVDRLFSELAAADLPVPATAAVIARGRPRRHRSRATTALAAAAATALVVAGVGQLAGAGTRTPAPGSHGRKVQTVCAAAPDPALTAALTHRLPLSRQVIALSPDGTLAFADVSVPGFHGIAEEHVATGAIVRRIDPLPASYVSAAGALTRNGDLIWISHYNGPGGVSAGSTPVRMWSPRTGRATVLEPPGQHGAALSAPVLYQQSGGLAAWLQTDGKLREVVAANLGTGEVEVVARGFLGPPVFVGDALVWSAARTARGYPAHLVARYAIPFPSARRVAIPPALRSADGGVLMGSTPSGYWPTPISLIASNAGATAYFSTSLRELFYSPAPSRPARLVLKLAGGVTLSPGSLALGDGYLTWSTDSAASYVASTRSLAVATITDGNSDYGDVQGLGDYVLSSRTATPKRGSPSVYLIQGSTIYGLSCARR